MIVLGQKLKDAVAHKPDVVPGVEKEKLGQESKYSLLQLILHCLFSFSRKDAKWHKNKHQICLNASVSEMSQCEPDPGNSSYQHCSCCSYHTRIPFRTSEFLHTSIHHIHRAGSYDTLPWVLFSAGWLVWSC